MPERKRAIMKNQHEVEMNAALDDDLRVLIVDDEPQIVQSIQRQLQDMPCATCTFTDPREALKEIRLGTLALIISDNMMPHMSGLEMLSMAMNLVPSARRILITGYTDYDLAIQAFNTGIIHQFLRKPWKRPALKSAVEDQLRIFTQRRTELQALHDLEQALDKRSKLLQDAVHIIKETESELQQTLHARSVERKMAVILNGDVVAFSRLMGTAHEATLDTLTRYRKTLATMIQQFSGRLVNAVGDSLLAEFVSVVDAVNFAVSAQHALAKENAELPLERRMEFRFGISVGDVLIQSGDLYGNGVNIAARLQALAEPGGICLSGSAYEQIKSRMPFSFRFMGEKCLKNIAEPVRVYAIDR